MVEHFLRRDICVITTCMGRLRFIERSCPAAIEQAPYILVDYNCPEHTGSWVAEHYPEAMVESVAGVRFFNKPDALNYGLERALAEGFPYVCFADADTVLLPGFIDWVAPRLRPEVFMIAAGCDHRDLTGLLVVSAEACKKIHGFDKTYIGWGAEDLDMRIRLRLLLNLDFEEIPLGLLDTIEHGDELRVENYAIKDRLATSRRNYQKLMIKIRAMSGDPAVLRRKDMLRLYCDESTVSWRDPGKR